MTRVFTRKNWHDDPIHDTPVSATGLMDLEKRVTDYTDFVAPWAVSAGLVPISDSSGNISWVSSSVAAATLGYEQTANKGAASGYASLDGSSRVVQSPKLHAGDHNPLSGADPFIPTNTGAPAQSRYVGATTSGAPTSGTFAVGDFIVDRTGQIWICTTAGTPGTWQVAGSGLSLASQGIAANFAWSTNAVTDVTGLSITFTAPSRPVILIARCYSIQQGSAAGAPILYIRDNAGTTNYGWAYGGQQAAGVYTQTMMVRSVLDGTIMPALTAGTSYTFKVSVQSGAATTGATLVAGTGGLQAYIQALTA